MSLETCRKQGSRMGILGCPVTIYRGTVFVGVSRLVQDGANDS